MLAKIKAGRARAFFKGSSTTGLLGLGFLAASSCRVVERGFLRAGPPSSADEGGRGTWGCKAGLISCRMGRWGCWKEFSGEKVVSLVALKRREVSGTSNKNKGKYLYIESRSPAGGSIRKGCGCGGSAFHPRNRFPVFPVSGVKNPAPVATGTGFPCESSGGARLTGVGRGGNSSSISGIDPSVRGISRGQAC